MSTEETLKQQIIEKAWQDSTFKQQLLSDPKAAIEGAFGVKVPDGIKLNVVEESSTDFYLVLPQNPADALDGEDDVNAAW
ncbi:NHLP leader peptide family RiPP precursor [Paenibacillus hodogayensis]|uniref:NHLP leader peptide family RiPP n=1 Tax=Paenibacillus hodogayensis TaxID=279208 RepID=A0ABV5W3Z1_9BACL